MYFSLFKNMSKQSRKEGNKVACLIKANKAEFYITDVDLKDNSDDVLNSIKTITRTLGKLKSAFMIISGGTKVVTIVAYVPSELSDKIDHNEWVRKSIVGLPEGKFDTGDNYTRAVIEADTPFKLKDMVRGNGFAFLTKKGCMGDEESSEEFIGFDDM